MSKKEKSIELLNKAVNDELLAVHQYMYFHFRCDDMGFDLVSNLFKRIAIQEMMHVEQLAERIFIPQGRSRNESGRRSEKADRGKRYVGTGGEDGNE